MHRNLAPGAIGAGATCAVMVLLDMQPTGPAILCVTLTVVWLGALLVSVFKEP
jgi:hypothetical protein